MLFDPYLTPLECPKTRFSGDPLSVCVMMMMIMMIIMRMLMMIVLFHPMMVIVCCTPSKVMFGDCNNSDIFLFWFGEQQLTFIALAFFSQTFTAKRDRIIRKSKKGVATK